MYKNIKFEILTHVQVSKKVCAVELSLGGDTRITLKKKLLDNATVGLNNMKSRLIPIYSHDAKTSRPYSDNDNVKYIAACFYVNIPGSRCVKNK